LADAADLIGLPDFELIECGGKAVKTTAFMRPKWLPMEGQKILVIVDEINRVTKDVANGLFGLIEAEAPFVGEYKLPKECDVVATCNPPTDNYAGVLDFADAAWTSRLCFVKVAPDIETYTNYGRESGTVSNVMLDFLNKNPKFFGTSGDFEVDMFFSSEGETEETNTRSFTKASGIYTTGKELGVDRNTIFELVRGIKGLEFATAFMQFADEYSTVITIDDLLTDTEAYKRFDYGALSSVSKVLEDLKHKITENQVEIKQATNIIPFLKEVPLDTLQGFVVWLVNVNNNKEGNELLTGFANELIKDKELLENLALVKSNTKDDNMDKESTDENN
jgi:hypothetical protein